MLPYVCKLLKQRRPLIPMPLQPVCFVRFFNLALGLSVEESFYLRIAPAVMPAIISENKKF